jgi:hypothetical protein
MIILIIIIMMIIITIRITYEIDLVGVSLECTCVVGVVGLEGGALQGIDLKVRDIVLLGGNDPELVEIAISRGV